MADWESGDVTVKGVRLHYTRTGGAKPPLVLAHGFSDDGLCWTPVAQRLQDDYDVVMPDARCHGLSDAPDEPVSVAHQVDDLAGLIQALGLSRPFILGHSMGAATTLALAAMHPDLPRAILLEDPPAWWDPQAIPGHLSNDWRVRMQEWIADLHRKPRQQIIEEQRRLAPSWSDAELGPWADSKLRLHPNALNRSDESVDWASLVRRINCPTLLITADPDRGALVTQQQAEALRQVMPSLTVAHIPGAGHSVRREQFERYVEVVTSFLASHAA